MTYPDTHDLYHPPSGYGAIGRTRPTERDKALAVLRAILQDMDEAFYDSNMAKYQDKRNELYVHVEKHLPK